jgi:hypothetical protein
VPDEPMVASRSRIVATDSERSSRIAYSAVS